MKPPWLLIVSFLGLVAAYLLGAFMYSKGYEAGHEWGVEQMQVSEAQWVHRAWQEEVDVNGSRAQTKDATQRWVRKNGGHSGMRGRYPYVMYSPDRNCIQFRIVPPGVGGTPTYCYRANTLQLIEEHTDVQ